MPDPRVEVPEEAVERLHDAIFRAIEPHAEDLNPDETHGEAVKRVLRRELPAILGQSRDSAWAERWLLGSDTDLGSSSTIALHGRDLPSGERIEVVERDEAERKIAAIRKQERQRVREALKEQAAEYRREADEADGIGSEKMKIAAQVVECVTRIISDPGAALDTLEDSDG